MAPKFLSLAEVLEIHQDQIARFGGASGIRDIELLKSALGMPPATFGGEFLHTDLCQMVAAYLFHLVKNHPFVDGNKRVGVVAALVFLTLNGFDVTAPEDELAEMVLAVARGEMDKAQIAVFIRNWSNTILVSNSPNVSFPNN
jgi:death-on-curing protein